MNVVRFEEQSLKDKTAGCRETHRTRSNIRYVEKIHQDLGRRVEVGTNELVLSDKLTLQLMKTCLPRKQLSRLTRGRMLRGRRLHLAKTKFNRMPVNKNEKGGLHGKASTAGRILMDSRSDNHRNGMFRRSNSGI